VDWHGYLVVALSQSGSTPEITATAQAVRTAGAAVIAITNQPGSPLAGIADLVLDTSAGPEQAIPATKTVTAQMMLLITITAALGTGPAGAGSLAAVPDAVSAVPADPEPATDLARAWQRHNRLVVTGRGLAYAAALETALKIKETTGILAEGISTADLRHGPIAAAYAGTPVLLPDTGGPAAADSTELRDLLSQHKAEATRLPLPPGVPGLPEAAQVLTAVVRGQQLAHALALAKGADPDCPAGLTKITRTI